ncbi:GGDEF domain-containing protein [Hydrogenophaga sp. OTU3427]|uniref:GGDEF domain-containing protein n=1 Tax=Hydrogenophaga sp. OTU3427 TaxID=3043856 RepID=UPI00313C1E7D
MPEISVFTVLVLTALNLLTVSITLPLLMGRRISRAARLSQLSLLSQAGGWLTIIASSFWVGHWMDWALSTATMVLASLAPYLLFLALAEWLGPRPGKRLLQALVVLMPLGYALLFPHYSQRVGWANFLLAAQLLVVAHAALHPVRPAQRHWRWLLGACHLLVALFTLARGVLGAFFPELYPHFQAPHPINIGAQIAANVALVLTTISVLVAWRDEAEAQLRTLARTDGLTGVLNHRAWHEQADAAFAHARRHQVPLTVVLLDLDHFKTINDRHGHEVGDRALRLFGQALRASVRTDDLAGRLGGEEFALLLSNTPLASVAALDRRLRERLVPDALPSLGFGLPFSAGAASIEPGDTRLRALLARADQAMYAAKAAGRARLVLADVTSDATPLTPPAA